MLGAAVPGNQVGTHRGSEFCRFGRLPLGVRATRGHRRRTGPSGGSGKYSAISGKDCAAGSESASPSIYSEARKGARSGRPVQFWVRFCVASQSIRKRTLAQCVGFLRCSNRGPAWPVWNYRIAPSLCCRPPHLAASWGFAIQSWAPLNCTFSCHSGQGPLRDGIVVGLGNLFGPLPEFGRQSGASTLSTTSVSLRKMLT